MIDVSRRPCYSVLQGGSMNPFSISSRSRTHFCNRVKEIGSLKKYMRSGKRSRRAHHERKISRFLNPNPFDVLGLERNGLMVNRILLVDDEPSVLSSLKRSLHHEQLVIITAAGADEALGIMKEQEFKVIISDERMSGMQGAEFLVRVRQQYPCTLRILMTGYASTEVAMKAVNEGEIYRFFMKPWDDNHLKLAVRSAMEKFDLEAENRRLLTLIRQQALEIKVLERRYPGISRVEKDRHGAFILPDLAEEDIKGLLLESEKDFL
jgi:two-component system, probable response regulator PhcQ